MKRANIPECVDPFITIAKITQPSTYQSTNKATSHGRRRAKGSMKPGHIFI
jgi:hypothetical protein